MGSRVAPTTATPHPRWFNTNEGTGRSTVQSQAIVMSAGRQIRQASKQTIKINNAEVTPQRACHRPIPTIHGLWSVKGATCGQLPIGNRDMLHTSSARFDPSRWDPRMVKPDWAIAASYGPARAHPPRRRQPWGGAPPSPYLGEVWWNAVEIGVGGPRWSGWVAWACVCVCERAFLVVLRFARHSQPRAPLK